MSKYIAVTSDRHGDAQGLSRDIAKLPIGTTTYYAGDMYGPSDRSYTYGIGNKAGAMDDRAGNFGAYLSGLYNEGQMQSAEHKKWVEETHRTTGQTIDVLVENSAKNPVGGLIFGNGEVYHSKIWESYATTLESPSEQFRQGNLPLVEKPEVHFYAGGHKVEGMQNVDTAVVLLPYVLNENLASDISRITGKPVSQDEVRQAIYEIIRDDGIADKIRAANPKYVIQIQHENPSIDNIMPYVKKADPPENEAIYRAAVKEISNAISRKGSRTSKYIIVYGHIGDHGRISQKVSFDGNEVDTLHMDEGGEFVLIDTETGKIYDQEEIPESDNYALVGEISEHPENADHSHDEHSLEAIVGGEGESSSEGNE